MFFKKRARRPGGEAASAPARAPAAGGEGEPEEDEEGGPALVLSGARARGQAPAPAPASRSVVGKPADADDEQEETVQVAMRGGLAPSPPAARAGSAQGGDAPGVDSQGAASDYSRAALAELRRASARQSAAAPSLASSALPEALDGKIVVPADDVMEEDDEDEVASRDAMASLERRAHELRVQSGELEQQPPQPRRQQQPQQEQHDELDGEGDAEWEAELLSRGGGLSRAQVANESAVLAARALEGRAMALLEEPAEGRRGSAGDALVERLAALLERKRVVASAAARADARRSADVDADRAARERAAGTLAQASRRHDLLVQFARFLHPLCACLEAKRGMVEELYAASLAARAGPRAARATRRAQATADVLAQAGPAAAAARCDGGGFNSRLIGSGQAGAEVDEFGRDLGLARSALLGSRLLVLAPRWAGAAGELSAALRAGDAARAGAALLAGEGEGEGEGEGLGLGLGQGQGQGGAASEATSAPAPGARWRELERAAALVFADVGAPFDSPESWLPRFAQWRAEQPEAFEATHCGLVLADLLGLQLRLRLALWDPLGAPAPPEEEGEELGETAPLAWLAWLSRAQLEPAPRGLAQRLLARSVLPALRDAVERCWEPLAVLETPRVLEWFTLLARVCEQVSPAGERCGREHAALAAALAAVDSAAAARLQALADELCLPLADGEGDAKLWSHFVERQLAQSLLALRAIRLWACARPTSVPALGKAARTLAPRALAMAQRMRIPHLHRVVEEAASAALGAV